MPICSKKDKDLLFLHRLARKPERLLSFYGKLLIHALYVLQGAGQAFCGRTWQDGNEKARIEATVLNSLTPLSKADICSILPDVSPTTVEPCLVR